MGGLIALIFVVIIAAAGIFVIARGSIEVEDRYGRRPKALRIAWIGWLLIVAALLGLAVLVMTTVPTRTIAVTTSFGKPTGTIKNGFHLIAPWESTEEFSTSVQTLRLSGDGDDNGEPITVRLANGATARADFTVQWQIDPNANIVDLYSDFRRFEDLDRNVIRRVLSERANAVFEKYDPLLALKGEGQPVALADLAADVKGDMVANVPAGITIRTVMISKIDFDPAIQEKLNAFQAAQADTQIAEQRQKTAEAQKRANDLLAQANNTPGVLYQNCLDMVDRLTKEGKVLPAAFTCGTPPGVVVSVK